MADIKELRDRRGKLVAEMRALLDQAETAKRDLSNEDQGKYDAMFAEQERVGKQIDTEERQRNLDREIAAAAAPKDEDRGKTAAPGSGAAEKDQRMAAFRRYLTGGERSLSDAELRALQAGNNAEGGYLLAPEQFVASLIQAVDDSVFIRAAATKFRVQASQSLGAPSLDTDLDDFSWTVELGTGAEDTAMRIGKRELKPHPMAKRIKVSKTLLRASALPIETIIMQRMAYKLGITQEKAYLTGSGAAQPLGVFTASNDGIGTARDVSTGNTATSITFDGLREAKYSVKAQYWPRASWVFHRDAVKAVSKLKDGDGQYLWQQSVKDGDPDTILGRPMMVSEYAPNTFTTGLYVGLFGDFSHYWIADALDMQVQRLTELYAETNQDGFIGRYEGDGMPVLAEAFARVKLA